MWQRSIKIIASFVLLLLFTGCADTKNDTYFRFSVEGKQYEVNDIAFAYVQLRSANRYFYKIGQNHMRSESAYQVKPDGSIQWITSSKGLEELQGKEIIFSEIVKEAQANHFAVPAMSFTSELLNVYAPLVTGGNMVVNIVRINTEYAEGTFSGTEFTDSSLPKNVARAIPIAGSFRARLIRIQL